MAVLASRGGVEAQDQYCWQQLARGIESSTATIFDCGG
jgi:hypothetical protein